MPDTKFGRAGLTVQLMVMVNGQMLDVQDVVQIPSVGEVVTIENRDLVVTSLRLSNAPVINGDIPVVNLLPVSGLLS